MDSGSNLSRQHILGSHEANEREQINPSEQVCLSRGDIYNDPSILRFYQNDDTSPWGNIKHKEKGEDGPKCIVRMLEMDEDKLVLIVLGWPFLATARAVIDVHEGKLSLRVGGETVTFNIRKSLKSKHSRDDYLYYADHTAKLVQEQWVDAIDHDEEWTEEEEKRNPNEALVVSFYPRTEPLEWKALEKRLKPSSEEPPKLELKELSEHLEYSFLQENNQLPVVISSALSIDEKTRLLEVIRNHKGGIAWSTADIKRIDSSFCTHKILMEDKFKLSVVPKEGGMTVVKNEKDELIPQWTVIEWRLCIDYPTFQRCITAIFHELIEDSIEVFMDDFSVFGNSFDHCLKNLEKMLKRCEETNIVLNWEKCHFMVKEGKVLGHKVSGSGIEVDKAKIEAISKLPYPTNVKAIQSFLGHAGLYRRFIKYFSQIARPMTQLLVKDAPFNFFEECIQGFDTLKRELTQAPIMIKPVWSLPFEIMCDKSVENLAADHLSRLENPDLGKLTKAKIRDLFLEEQLMAISDKNGKPCDLHHYFWDEPFLFKQCADRIIRRCLAGDEATQIIQQCHNEPFGGHHGIATFTRKVFEAGFYWQHIFRDARKLVQSYDACQREGNISSRDETPQKYIKVCEIFDVWRIDFMGSFPSSKGNKYGLVAIDYVSKCVEAQAFPTNDARNVVNFLKRLFARFRIPKALISDRGTHFYNSQMERAMKRYGVVHRFSTGYHPQTNGQVIFEEKKLGSSEEVSMDDSRRTI
nr:hypothetical protein [Tanacetum cinerariifolium]